MIFARLVCVGPFRARVAVLSIGLLLAFAAGCSDSKTANDAKPCATSSLDTAGEAAKAGGSTAVEGVKTLGDSVGGFFSGGTEEAKQRWKQGSQSTKEAAREGGAETKESARANECD